MKKLYDKELFTSLELFEEKVWLNMFDLAPSDWKKQFGLQYEKTPHGIFFFCEKIPFIHFNAVMTLGLNQFMNKEILDLYDQKCIFNNSVKAFLIVAPFGETEDLNNEAIRRGFNPIGSWERIYRKISHLPELKKTSRPIEVHHVNDFNRKAWAQFIDAVYQLPTSPWLLSLDEKHGWHHFIAQENGKIVAARSVFIERGFAWSGIDAPVPGIMTKDFEPDYNLFYEIFTLCNKEKVKHFICDIEQPDDSKSAAPYTYLLEMGCAIPYRRMNYMKVY